MTCGSLYPLLMQGISAFRLGHRCEGNSFWTQPSGGERGRVHSLRCVRTETEEGSRFSALVLCIKHASRLLAPTQDLLACPTKCLSIKLKRDRRHSLCRGATAERMAAVPFRSGPTLGVPHANPAVPTSFPTVCYGVAVRHYAQSIFIPIQVPPSRDFDGKAPVKGCCHTNLPGVDPQKSTLF